MQCCGSGSASFDKPDPTPHQSQKKDPDPVKSWICPHQSENRIRIRVHVKMMQIRTQKIVTKLSEIWIRGIRDPKKTYPGSGGSKKHGIPEPDPQHHRLNMKVDLQSLFGLHVTWCAQLSSLAESPQLPPPPAFGLVLRGRYWSAKIAGISL